MNPILELILVSAFWVVIAVTSFTLSVMGFYYVLTGKAIDAN